jgi:hypothetical protein
VAGIVLLPTTEELHMTREDILNLVDDKHIFSVRFLKKDGTERTMNCMFGVQKHVTGKGKKFDDADHNLITVYEFKSKGYRSFKADSVIEIKANGEVYE